MQTGTVTAIANNTLSTGGNNTSQQFELIAPVNVPITSATAAAVGPAYEYGLSQAAATASCGSITLSSITSASVVAFVGANNLVGSSLVGWWQFSDGQGTSISDFLAKIIQALFTALFLGFLEKQIMLLILMDILIMFR